MKLRLLAGLCAALVAGCGDKGIPLLPVAGTVTLDGQPVRFKSVRFVPEPGTPGLGAGANTNAAGEYKLLAVRPGATTDVYGVPAGKYKVIVTEPQIPILDTDPPPPAATGDTPAPAVGPPRRRPAKKSEALPVRYTNPDTTTFVIEVSEGTKTINLELTTK